MPSRTVILHNHFFKNAGTTIDWALKKNFGESFVDHRDDVQMEQGHVYLSNYLEHNPYIKALSSHHLAHPLPILPRTDLLQIIMVRHPIERAVSVYRFERKQQQSISKGALHARNSSLPEYIIWRMRSDAGPVIRNFQTRRALRIHDFSAEVPLADFLQLATQFARSVDMLGLVDRFDESMVLFEERLAAVFPSIDLSYLIQNTSGEMPDRPELRFQRWEAEMGEAVHRLLLENNLRDLQLLDVVKEEFESRLSRVPRLSDKLMNFRNRCVGHLQRLKGT